MRRAAKILVVTAGLALSFGGGVAEDAAAQPQAQNWPQRVVRLIVPLAPGSATDVTARLYAERLAARWGEPVVVENRPGPDGLIAVNAFLSATDKHTLLFSFGGPVSINPILYDKLPYDPKRGTLACFSPGHKGAGWVICHRRNWWPLLPLAYKRHD